MNGKPLLRLLSHVPGLYAMLAFLFARRVRVRGRSMWPALLPGERLLADRLAYVRGRPQRGDIVVADHPSRRRLRIVKRIAGVPGDEVEWRGATRTLGRGEYWLLGDNADESTDSRTLGPFRREALRGRGWLVFWPAERMRKL